MTARAGRVEGKVAFITGAARGQGRSHAVRLAEEGADIIALDICAQIESVGYPLATAEDLDETVREVRALGRRIVPIRADVRDLPTVEAELGTAVAELGRLDIVAANAGICSFGRADALSSASWQDVIDINLTGVWHTIRAASPHVIAGGRGGSIVITSSAAGLHAHGGIGHYVAAKHGLVGLMRTFALELAAYSIRVNSLHPTTVRTPLGLNEQSYRQFRPDLDNPGREDAESAFQALNLLPVPWVESVDVSNALLFLASDEARYITGVTLPVDAGNLIK
jgi:(+)-trans-carveol dehydrogenase